MKVIIPQRIYFWRKKRITLRQEARASQNVMVETETPQLPINGPRPARS
jgi:hypothetical protein